MPAAGQLEEQQLISAGFSNDEVQEWKGQTAKQLSDAGFSIKEVDEYFGVKEPDMTPTKNFIEQNRSAASPDGKPAEDFIGAIEAGWQMSVSGLISRGQKPDVLLPEHAPMAYKIASQMSTLAGDLPAMIGGAVGGTAAGIAGGGAVGSAVPVVGTAAGAAVGGVLGGGAGSFALPEAIRSTLMQHYEKGDVTSFSDFWTRASAVFLDTMKAGAVGAATAGVGGVVGKVVAPLAAPAIAKTSAQVMSEIATMVTVGKGMEGQVPEPQDFVMAAIMVGGMHGSVTVAGKLRSVYAKTGMKPEQIAEMAQKDPTVVQDLLSDNVDIPSAIDKTPVQEKVLESGLTEKSNVLADSTQVGGVSIPPMAEKAAKPFKGRTPEEQAVLDRLSPSAERKAEPLTFNEAYRRYIDDLHPLKQFTEMVSDGKPVLAKDDPYQLARLTRGSYGKADQFIELSPFKFDTLENTGKSFKKIMEPVHEDLDAFRAYATAARTLEKHKQGVFTGVPLPESEAVVKAGKAKFQPIMDELQGYQTNLINYLKDSGILSAKSYKAMMSANKDYVPFYRLVEEDGGKAVGSGVQGRNPIKEMKGSGKLIIDPIESIIKNTYLYVTLAERNRVMTTMLDRVKELPEGAGDFFMKKENPPTRAIEINEKEVQDILEQHGIEGIDAETATIFRSQRMPLAENEVVVYNKGDREVYSVNPDVAKSLKALDKESVGLLTKILSVPAKMLRAGTILSPEFVVRNLARDQLAALTLSKNGYIPIVDALEGLGSLFKKDEHYQNWLKSGGANSAMVSIDRDYIQNHIFKLSKDTGLIDRVFNVVKSPFEAMRVVSELIENSTRLGEFKKATKGDSSINSLFAGGMDSREVTLDFARIGAKTRAMNLITSFWNAHVQGLDRTARAFAENPAGMSVKMTAAVTMPSLLLWYANHDDPRWKEIPRWQKDLFWIVMTKDHVFRIPKPFELGLIFGSLPERALEAYVGENPKAFKEFGSTLGQAFAPSYIPTFAVPVVEHFANRSTFTGGPIVPSSVEKILPEYQHMEYTTEAAKQIGKLVSRLDRTTSLASPMVIENYVRAWSGSLGMYALQLADVALTKSGVAPDPVKPIATLSDIPIIKAFTVRYPSSTAQSIQDFYKRAQESEVIVNTIHHLAKSGDFQNVEKELLLSQNQDKLVSLSGMRDALTNQTKFIRLIYKNPDMKPEEKRQIIDSIYSNMIETSQAGNKIFEELEKVLK